MKRFWSDAALVEAEDGFAVMLDGKPLKTPAGAPLVLPSVPLAQAVVDEWSAVEEAIDPRAMPMTGLANAAIDRGHDEMVAGIVRFADSDQFCYRAEGPSPLMARQAEAWDALLGWARRRYDVDFATCSGIMHVTQPPDTIRRLGHEVAILDSFRLAGLSPLVTIGGSLVAGLAVLEQAIPADAAWEAVSLDEQWQLEKWGSDAEAEATLDSKRSEFLAGARFLALLG